MKKIKPKLKIVLASQSPRRVEILKEIGLNFTTDPSQFTEKENYKNPKALAIHNAQGKAREVALRHKNSIIIAADTIGVIKGQILGKPRDRNHAYELISKIKGTTHEVITGICIIDTMKNREIIKAVSTKIFMAKISEKEIQSYLDSDEWKDKAAAYAIQGRGALFIEKIEGDYFNVVGLPLFTLQQTMKELGVSLS